MMSFLEAQNSTTGPQLTVSKNAKKLWNTYCVHTKTFSKTQPNTKCYFKWKLHNFTTVKIVVIRSENN